MLNISENIKQLRQEQKITQKDLAKHMNVSHQTVSKWETGSRAPDIQMLPMLASFFGVSIDDLFYDKEFKKREYETRVRDKINKYIANRRFEQARELTYEAYAKMPDSFILNERYIYFRTRDKNPDDCELLESLSYHLINACYDKSIVNSTICTMITYYASIGEHEKALDMAKERQDVWSGNEHMTCIAADDGSLKIYAAKAMYAFLKMIFIVCEKYERIYDSKQLLDSYNRCIDIYKLCFNNNTYGDLSGIMCRIRVRCAACYLDLGDIDMAFDQLEKSTYFYELYYSSRIQSYTDVWLSGLDFDITKNNNLYPEFYRDFFKDRKFDRFKADERFEKIVSAAERKSKNYII